MKRLQGKIALISGVTSGIGHAAAILFAREGAAVVLGARRKEEGEKLVAEIRGQGGQAEFRVTDVTKHEDNAALVELALSKFGRLDIAFNNAGIEATGALVEYSEATYDRVFGTNVKGVLSAIQAQVPALTKTHGSIVLTSSIAGSRGFPGASIYAASKHAVEGIVKSAALELASLGVRVNAVAPGPTDTPMLDRFTGGQPAGLIARIPLGRAASSEEVALAALWLATDEARYITGVTLPVNGGFSA